MVEARCDSVVDVVKGSCGGVFGFEAMLCMMLWDERRMQPARGRFARFDLDRQIASTFPAHWKVGPAPVFRASRPLEPTKVMVSSGITQDCLSKSKVDPCGVSSLRLNANSVLCVQ